MTTTIDWPVDRAFRPASLTFGSTTSKSGLQGFYSGDRQEVSHLSDRLTALLTLGPVKGAVDAGRRSAYLRALDSSGDWVRFGALHSKGNLGKWSGSPTVGVSALAGAESITLAGVLSAPNLILNSSFEFDTNADGMSDGWAPYSAGTTGSITNSRSNATAVFHGAWVQLVNSTNLGTSSADRIGISRSIGVTGGSSYTVSAYLAWTQASTSAYDLWFDWYDAGAVFISSSHSGGSNLGGTLTRYAYAASAPSNAVTAIVYVFAHSRVTSAGAAGLKIDAVQVELGATASAYAGYPTAAADDVFGIGGNLLQCAYAGAQGNDAGAMVVPLVLPLQKPVTAGAAVALAGATGSWKLDSDGIALDYSPAAIQQGIALQFRQVIV